jgi:3'-5' exonuclease
MALPPSLVFDIETIPDTAGLRLAWSLGGSGPDALDDAAVAQAALDRRREATGRDFLPHHLHRVVAIGCVFRNGDDVRIRCLGEPGDDERRLINDFFRAIERYTPQLVSWNGSGFDLPVLHYRALIHGIRAPRYWDHGEIDRDFRFNNYLSRFHSRHLDLMDVLAGYTGRANAPLDELARLCGLPGKLGMDGSQVWPAWQRGEIGRIRDYCETDVANTWLLFCRFRLMNGQLTSAEYADEVRLFRDRISALAGDHWREYLAAWPQPAESAQPTPGAVGA